MRDVNRCDLLAVAESAFKILQAHAFDHQGDYVWAVELTVGRALKEVSGWAFVDRHTIEVRFERQPSMQPPGFLSGSYLSLGVEESTLAQLFDRPSEADISHLEALVRDFVGKCRFCVRSVTDVASGASLKQATAYRYGCATIPITRAGSHAR